MAAKISSIQDVAKPTVRLSVVIPALDEATRLPGTMEQACAHLVQADWLPAEVVVVDDGSRDATAAVAGSQRPPDGIEVVVLSHPMNRGKGAAVRTGFAAARGALVLLTDADLSSPISELGRLARVAGPRTVVIGSRAVDRSLITVPQPRYRDLMGRAFNLVLRVILLPGLGDTQCGFKLFPGDLARALAAVQRLDGFAYDVELLLRARGWGFGVREVAVRWDHVEASRVHPVRHSLQMLRDLVRLWWWLHTGELDTIRPAALERLLDDAREGR